MPIKVRACIYSGRPDPEWELTSEQTEKLLELLSRKNEKSYLQSPSKIGLLGYRGLEIRFTGVNVMPRRALVFNGVLDIETEPANLVDQDSELELFLLETAGGNLKDKVKQRIGAEIQKNLSAGLGSVFTKVMAAPPYDPGKWNNNIFIMEHNNCYNYGNNLITDSFAQPGRGSGLPLPDPLTLADTRASSISDQQIALRAGEEDLTPDKGHYIALVLDLTMGDDDYHWYRQNDDGTWSHKPGRTAVINTDNSGDIITDPEHCDRGAYTVWGGYFLCISSQTKIF